jgi:hypothetical protein
MKKALLLFLFAALPVAGGHGDCRLGQAIVEPSPAWYGEEVDIRMRGDCAQGVAPHSPRISVNGATIAIDLSHSPGGVLVPSSWGERVHLGKLLPGTYPIVVRSGGEEWYRHTLIVRARPFDVVPMVGRAGTRVMIRGLHDIACAGPNCQAVRFGGVPGTDPRFESTASGSVLTVAVPPHADGAVVDVTVQGDGGRLLTLPNGFRYGEPGDADYERVLFPVNYAGGGVNGSRWNSEIAVYNTSPVTLTTRPLLTGSPVVIATPPPPPLFGGRRLFFHTERRDGGAFLYVPRGAEEYLAYSAHIINSSGARSERGAEVPVVRARDTSASIHLPFIAFGAGSRATLRVYDFDALPSRRIVVTARGELGHARSFELNVETLTLSCPLPPCFQPTPGFASVELSSIAALRDLRAYDLTIVSPERDARLWAFLSVTNNETQQVMLYTPQHRRPQQ